MVVLIPLFVIIYRNAYRRFLIGSFVVVGIFGSLIPNIIMTLKYDINAYPGYLSNGFDYLFMKIYYRIPPFIMGIALAIIKFEYKFVGTLNDGTKPFHKSFIDKFRSNRLHKFICYTLGLILSLFSVLILISNNSCVDKNTAPDNKFRNSAYCWSSVTSAFYNAFG